MTALGNLTQRPQIATFTEGLLDGTLGQVGRARYSAEWITVHEDGGNVSRDAGNIALGDQTFATNGGGELGDGTLVRHAETWHLYHRVFSLFNSMGPEFAFIGRVALKYPHDNPRIGDGIEAPYANPSNKIIYVIRNATSDWFSIGTLLHELMHIWAYQHSRGELGMAWQLALHGDTHGYVAKPWVAFHEGFAEYAYHQVHRRLFRTLPNNVRLLPYNRDHLRTDLDLGSVGDVERHDEGWVSVLNMLTARRLHQYNFNTTGGNYVTRRFVRGACTSPEIGFDDVLSVFLPEEESGIRRVINVRNMTIRRFLDRAQRIIDGYTRVQERAHIDLADPVSTVQPGDRFCA